jgi:hypothetical protein
MHAFFSKNRQYFYPVVLFIVGLAAYGILLYRPGFYWDDWESVYLSALHNPGISFQYFGDRPLSALIYVIFFPITNMTPLVWLIIEFILRWAGVLGIYYALNKVWPERIFQNQWVGILLFVFPAFLQQAVALCYSRHFSSFALFCISLFLTIIAIKDRKRFWIWFPLSVLLGLVQIYIIEYFVGLEILRPLLIWFALNPQAREEKKSAFAKTLLLWAPFVTGLLFYFGWRFVTLPRVIGGDPNNPNLLISFIHSPFHVLPQLSTLILQDLWYLTFSVWTGWFSADKFAFLHSKIVILAWFLAIIATLLVFSYIKKTSLDDQTTKNKLFSQMFFLGLAAFLGGGIPVWATSRLVSGGKWSDRFAMAPMVGASIIIVYLIDWMIRTHCQKQILLSFMLAVSISIQVFNANTFRKDWTLQRSIYWQLAWRIPALKPGTTIIGRGTFTDKSSTYDGIYIVNLLFNKQVKLNPDYGYIDVYHISPSSFSANQPISIGIKGGGEFVGNTSQAIGMYFDTNGVCVRLLDPIYAGDPSFDEEPNGAIPLSNLDLVIPSDSPSAPDPAIFGLEPAHDWCYYFEKADLARQRQDWGTIIQLDSKVEAKGFKPIAGEEYLPFIEAYTQTGNWSKAYDLSLSAKAVTPLIDRNLCANWNRFAGIAGGQDRDVYLSKAKSEFCGN